MLATLQPLAAAVAQDDGVQAHLRRLGPGADVQHAIAQTQSALSTVRRLTTADPRDDVHAHGASPGAEDGLRQSIRQTEAALATLRAIRASALERRPG